MVINLNREKPATNSTFSIGGVSGSADSFVVAESFVLRMKFSAGRQFSASKRQLLVAANRLKTSKW